MPASGLDRNKCAEAVNVCACFSLRKASRAVSKLYDDVLQPIGLRSTQFVTILAIFLNEPIGLSPLARAMVADRSTLTRNLNVLERGGLIRSKPVGGRTRVYSLTDKGRRVLEDGIPLWEKAQGMFVEQLGTRQWSTMLAGLDAAVRAARGGL
jgi:DNA-binding MarR family transcriptional regulator